MHYSSKVKIKSSKVDESFLIIDIVVKNLSQSVEYKLLDMGGVIDGLIDDRSYLNLQVSKSNFSRSGEENKHSNASSKFFLRYLTRTSSNVVY